MMKIDNEKLFVFPHRCLTLVGSHGLRLTLPKGTQQLPRRREAVLNLFSWADNFDPEVITPNLKSKTTVKVNYDVFANNEELLAKIEAGGAQCRPHPALRLHSSNYAEANLLEELDLIKYPMPKYRQQLEGSCLRSHRQAFPCLHGAYRHRLQQKYIKTPTSWEDLWNPVIKCA